MNTRDCLAGAGMGVALAFMFDPDRGRRRRALVRDKLVWSARKTRDGLDATVRDMSHRAQGTLAAARRRLSNEQADDVTLLERVRSRLGRVCSHPRALEVDVAGGTVSISGPILAEEAADVLSAACHVPGVCEVVDALDRHATSDGVPALQGRGRVAGPRLDILQRNWAPATEALVGAAVLATGVCAVAYARRRQPA